jgi:hypothetical protein
MPEEKTLFEQIIDIDKELKDLSPILKKIETLKKEKVYLITRAVEAAKKTNIYQIGDFKLKNIPKKENKIDPQKFHDIYREQFWQIASVPINKATELVGREGLDGILETNYKDNWQLVTLWKQREVAE